MLIFQIICENIVKYYDSLPLELCNIILKLDLILLLSFSINILIYLINLTHSKSSFNIANKIVITIFILSSILISCLPIYVYSNEINGTYYYFGVASKFTYYVMIINYILSILIILFRAKKLSVKKVLSILLFSLIQLFTIYIQMSHPIYTFVVFVNTMFCVVMYFVIENPDIKVLEQIEKAQKKIDSANQGKNEFLLSMFHEIRTPLNAIMGFSESLSEEQLSDSAREEVDDILNASETLLNKLNGILDFSNIEDGNIKLYESDYSFTKIYKTLVTKAKKKINSNIEFRYDIAKDIPSTLYGDGDKVKQIITNILSNSIKYTKRGYISFNARCLNNNDICRLIITIEDSGIGIKRDDLDKSLNYINDNDIGHSSLAVTKKMIEFMHGKLIVQSFYKKGSQFMIILDQKIVNNNNLEMPEEIINDLSNKKVLIVDDNNLNLKVEKRLLNSYNISAEAVLSGLDAINLIKSGYKYDLILMDDKMPNMDGIETLKVLKTINSFNTPVVIITATVEHGIKEKYINLGFDDYLAKPIEKEELKRIIKKYLDK